MPESPRYLITAGNYEKAIKVLRKIARENGKAIPTGQLIVGDTQVRMSSGFFTFSLPFPLSMGGGGGGMHRVL